MLPYIQLFGREVPAYWLMGIAGIIAASLYLYVTNRHGKAGQIPTDDLLHIVLLAAVGALIGSKLLGIITILPLIARNWSFISANPSLLLELLTQGLVFYGGAIGGFLGVYWYCRRYHLSIKTVGAIVTPAVPLFHAFGRVGCFLAGCCWGIEVPWGPEFSHSLAAPNGVPLLPIQLIEAAANVIIFILLAVLSRKLSSHRKWVVLPLYVFIYALVRFTLEFFRGDRERGVFFFSTSQWISLALLVILALLYLLRWRKGTPQPKEVNSASQAHHD